MPNSSLRAVGWARSLPVSSGVKAARDWTREHLEDLNWSRSAPDTVDAVLLTVSELVTNTHIHARSTAQLVLAWDGECLHVTVHDNSPEPPRPRDAAADETGGRGLLLIDALADTWQAHVCPRGKDVTACFRPEPSQAEQTPPESATPAET